MKTIYEIINTGNLPVVINAKPDKYKTKVYFAASSGLSSFIFYF